MATLPTDHETNDPSVLYRLVTLAAAQDMSAPYHWSALKDLVDSNGLRVLAKPMEDFQGRPWTAAGIVGHTRLHVQTTPVWDEMSELLRLLPQPNASTLGWLLAGAMRPLYWSADPDDTLLDPSKERFESRLHDVIERLPPAEALEVESVAAKALLEAFQSTFMGPRGGSMDRARRMWSISASMWVEGWVGPTLPDWGHDHPRRPLVEMACTIKGLLARHAQYVDVSSLEMSARFAERLAGSSPAHADSAWQHALLSQSLALSQASRPEPGPAYAWAWQKYESIALGLLALEAQNDSDLVETFRSPAGKAFMDSVRDLPAVHQHLQLLDRDGIEQGWERFFQRAQVMRSKGLGLSLDHAWEAPSPTPSRGPRF